MTHETNRNILHALKNNQLDLALEMFNLLSHEEKKLFLHMIGRILVAGSNKAVVIPNYGALFKRKLKPNKSFDEFYEGWLPAVPPTEQNGKKVYDYFSLPTRSINFITHESSDEFYTFSMVYSPHAHPAATMEAFKAKHKLCEEKRKYNNEKNLEISELIGYGIILSDDIFGI